MSTTAASPTLQNFIDGAFVDAAEGATDTVVNPATGDELAQAPASSQADVDRAVAAARTAFDTWSRTTPATRQAALLALADVLEEHGDELDEIPFMADNLRFFAGAARCMEGKASGEYLEGYTSMIRREAVGVIGQIAPWNYT